MKKTSLFLNLIILVFNIVAFIIKLYSDHGIGNALLGIGVVFVLLLLLVYIYIIHRVPFLRMTNRRKEIVIINTKQLMFDISFIIGNIVLGIVLFFVK